MVDYIRIPIKFAGARSISVAAGQATVSDVFLSSGASLGMQGTFKADNAGTPTANDTVDFYLLGSVGDPDGDAATVTSLEDLEYASADATHGIHIVTVDTNVTDPAIKSAALPAYRAAKIRVVNNGASSVTASAVLRELID